MIRSRIWVTILLIFSGLMPIAAQEDYLMVEFPARLRVLNHYAIEAGYSEKSALPAFAPLLIQAEDTLLSDGFTRCMQVRYNGKGYYLLKSTQDSLINQDQAGRVFYARNTRTASDSFQVISDDLELLEQPNRTAEPIFNLINGDLLRAHFRLRDYYFVSKPGVRPIFGWAYLPLRDKGVHWAAPQPKEIVSEDDRREDLLADLRFEVEKFNKMSANIYQQLRLNSATPAPQWQEAENDSVLLFLKLNRNEYGQQYNQSNRYLLNRLENILLGSPLMLRARDTTISILVRP